MGIEYRVIDDAAGLVRLHQLCFDMGRKDARRQLDWMLSDERAFIIAAFQGRHPVGYTAAIPSRLVQSEPFIDEVLPASLDDTVYLMRLGCLPEYRGRGIGKRLAYKRAMHASDIGYTAAAGHIQNGPALQIAKRTIIPLVEIPMERYGRHHLPHTYITGLL